MRRLILIWLGVGAAAACGAPAQAGVATGKSGPAAAATAITVPMPAGAADGSLTAAKVAAVAKASFPLVQPYGYYGVCGMTGDAGACPYTPRLKARLAQERLTLSRAQNPAASLDVAAEITGPTTGVAHVKLGVEALDLVVVSRRGDVLIDDESCTGRAGSSIYETVDAC